MHHVSEMLKTHPRHSDTDSRALAECIEACYDCAQTCTACADACLGEQQLQRLVRCIRLNLDCADVCAATGALLSRQTESEWSVIRAQLQACVEACRVCGAECEKHAGHHEHCRVCAEACRRCAEACERLVSAA
ncbi:MAG: four-helix bundle copper-binding protein [Gemmatimonadota bacterium]